MADISKCKNPESKGCGVFSNCYRFTATSSYWQSYADFTPMGVSCDSYWPNNPGVYRVKLEGEVWKRQGKQQKSK